MVSAPVASLAVSTFMVALVVSSLLVSTLVAILVVAPEGPNLVVSTLVAYGSHVSHSCDIPCGIHHFRRACGSPLECPSL